MAFNQVSQLGWVNSLGNLSIQTNWRDTSTLKNIPGSFKHIAFNTKNASDIILLTTNNDVIIGKLNNAFLSQNNGLPKVTSTIVASPGQMNRPRPMPKILPINTTNAAPSTRSVAEKNPAQEIVQTAVRAGEQAVQASSATTASPITTAPPVATTKSAPPTPEGLTPAMIAIIIIIILALLGGGAFFILK
jgi:hypothetical protein